MYSRIYTRLNWFFDYIGEPEEDEILFGDVNFDGTIDITDIVLVINFILGGEPTEEQELIADITQDGVVNILDVIQIVNEVLGLTFSEAVNWLEENFPELKTKERLSKLNKMENFSK